MGAAALTLIALPRASLGVESMLSVIVDSERVCSKSLERRSASQEWRSGMKMKVRKQSKNETRCCCCAPHRLHLNVNLARVLDEKRALLFYSSSLHSLL
jgi:hypothetical protein